MATTEIEKLERRYAENPQGLTFAPLAEVHRKNGDIPRALELLKSGLELHPNYIPASIVLGRCHWDQGDLPAAESAFAHVLRLDDENVIALKSLADISEKLGRSTEAQRWLKRLISIDRSNEEARQHLARLEGTKAEPLPVSTPAADIPQVPAAANAAKPVPQGAKPVGDSARPAPDPGTPAAAKPVPEPAKAASEAPKAVPDEPAALDLTTAIADPAPALEFLDTSEPRRPTGPLAQAADAGGDKVSNTKQPDQVDGLISQEFVPPKEGGYHLHPELTQEFEVPAGKGEQLEVETAAEVELQSSGASEFRVPNAAEDFMEAGPQPPVTPAPPPVTAAPPPARAPLPPAPPPPAPAPPQPSPARPSYSARETRGQSVAGFFQAMLNARPPGAGSPSDTHPDGKVPGTPPRDAAQPAGNSPGQRAPLSPEVSASGPAQEATVSFDDFFGAPAGGSAGPKGSDAGEDDLDQFQSWLQNLKP